MTMTRCIRLLATCFFLITYPTYAKGSGPKTQEVSSEDTCIQSMSANAQVCLACNRGKVSYSILWNEWVGTPDKYLRHIFAPTNIGDTHILLKVSSDGTSTGIINNDSQARSLIKYLLESNIADDTVVIEVFPEGRDQVTGEWVDATFNGGKFRASAVLIAKQCKWDLTKPIERSFRTVGAGAAYKDRDYN